MNNMDFIIRILAVVIGFPIFSGSIKSLMGTKKMTGENIFWTLLAYDVLLSVIL